MTEDRAEFADVLKVVVARWYIVLAVGLLVAALTAGYALMTAPKARYTALLRVRVQAPESVQTPPTPDTVVLAATASTVRQSAAASLGVDPSDIRVQAGIDPKDTQAVDLSVTAPQRDDAVRNMQAVFAAVREQMVVLLGTYPDKQREQLRKAERRIVEVNALEADIRETLRTAAPSDRANLLTTLTELGGQRSVLEEKRLAAQWGLTSINEVLNPIGGLGGIEVTRSSNRGRLISQGSRGLLIGLFLGALAVAVTARRR